MSKAFYVYIMASALNGTLYVGVTSDLVKRTWEHKQGATEGFTATYGVKLLVWFESHVDVIEAITREKQIKKWNREWKINLIQKENSGWRDLYPDIVA
jgi:putative endonuclease